MRVAIVTEGWLPTVNGMITRIEAAVRELTARGHEVLVISVTDDGSTAHGATVVTIPSFRAESVYPGALWGYPSLRFLREFRRFRPDIVHVVAPAWMGGSAILLARMLRLPVICSYHTDMIAYAHFYGLTRWVWLISFLLRFVYNRARVTLVTSEHARGRVSELGIRRTAMWPRGIDDAFFSAPALHESSTEDAVPATPTIRALYAGRLAEEKNLASLATMAGHPGIALTLAGDGPHRGMLEQTLPTSTSFVGMIDGDELRHLYAQSDVFVFPSLTDTLGLVLLEALACGLPVVAATSPAAQEVLKDCRAARLYDPADPHGPARAVLDLLGSGTRAELAAAARAQVAGISWASATDALEDAYAAVVAASSRTARRRREDRRTR